MRHVLTGLSALALGLFAAAQYAPQQPRGGESVRATGVAGAPGHAAPDQRGQQSPEHRAAAAAFRRGFGGASNWRPSYPNGPGWTVAQVKRMASKARNVKRNRRAHRG